MPSWSARNNNLNNPFPHSSSSAAVHNRSASRVLPQDIPILPSSPTNNAGASPLASPPHRRGHTRSISHPFAGIGKRRNRSISKRDFLDSDEDEFETTFTPAPLSTSPKKPLPRPPPPSGDEFTTGKCMTCCATVRWPRHLKTFRCTECLMVNDLEAFKESGDGHPGADGKLAIPRKGK